MYTTLDLIFSLLDWRISLYLDCSSGRTDCCHLGLICFILSEVTCLIALPGLNCNLKICSIRPPHGQWVMVDSCVGIRIFAFRVYLVDGVIAV